MAATPPDAQELLRKLEPYLTKWCNADTLGEIAITFGYNEMRIEERPVDVVEKVKFSKARSRAKVIEVVS